MNILHRFLAGPLFLLIAAVPTHAAQPSDLDIKYGVLCMPNYVKHYEVSKKNNDFWIAPYLQVVTKERPGVIEPIKERENDPYNWLIDAEGNLRLSSQAVAPYGRVYEKSVIRPEDRSKRRPGWTEKDGHPSLVDGAPARICGEIKWDNKLKSWQINQQSGRYSPQNPDRTPEQLLNAVKLIKESIDPGGAPWGEIHYLQRYAPKALALEMLTRPDIKFYDEAQKHPYIVLEEKK